MWGGANTSHVLPAPYGRKNVPTISFAPAGAWAGWGSSVPTARAVGYHLSPAPRAGVTPPIFPPLHEFLPRRVRLLLCPVARAAWAGARSFGVRQLAAAFRPASSLAGISAEGTIPRQQAGLSQSGSKLPHSKAQDDSLDRFSRRVAHRFVMYATSRQLVRNALAPRKQLCSAATTPVTNLGSDFRQGSRVASKSPLARCMRWLRNDPSPDPLRLAKAPAAGHPPPRERAKFLTSAPCVQLKIWVKTGPIQEGSPVAWFM